MKQIAALVVLLAACDGVASTTTITGTGRTTSDGPTRTEASPSASTPVEEAEVVRQAGGQK